MTMSPTATFCPAFRAVRDPAWLYPAEGHRQALTALEEGVDAGHAITLLSGKAGAGKTLLLYAIVAHYYDHLRVGWYSENGTSPNDPLRSALEAFRVDAPDQEPAELLTRMRKFLERGPGAGRPALLIVDDAHLLSDGALDQLRQASEIEADGAPLLCLILAGEPGLRARLATPRHLALKKRIGGQVDLPPLSESEAAGYVAHRLAIARCSCHDGASPFEPGALKILHHWSGGVPGALNDLARHCLHEADLARLDTIGASFVEIRLRAAGIRSDRGASDDRAPPDPREDGPASARREEDVAAVLLPEPAPKPRPEAEAKAQPTVQPLPEPEAKPLPVPYDQGAPAVVPARRRGSGAMVLTGAAAVAAGLIWVLLPGRDQPEIAAISPPPVASATDALPAEPVATPAEPAPVEVRVAEEVPVAPATAPARPAFSSGRLPPVTGIASPPDPAALMSEALEVGIDQPGLATMLYERAALRGHHLAAYFAGQAYETGEGVPVDHNRARGWYRIAGGQWGADERLEALEGRPVVEGLNSRPVPVTQTVFPSGQIEIHWRAAEGESPTGFAVEYVLAGGEGQPQRVETDRSAILLDGPVARWRVITLDAVGEDAEATDWISPSPAAR